jgi:hypothetical protein
MIFIILLVGTIMVTMGMTLHPSIYMTWFFVVTFPKYGFIYGIYHSIGWHHFGRNWSDSLSWYIHNIDFCCDIRKHRVIYELCLLLSGTIMVTMGLTLYHGIYTTWIFFCCGFATKRKMALYLILFFILLAGSIVAAMRLTLYHRICTRHGFFRRDIAEVQVEVH